MLFIAVFCLVFAIIAGDPFHLSPIADLDFAPTKNTYMKLANKAIDPGNRLRDAQKLFKRNFTGPESLAWDAHGALYTGVSDGRVLKQSGGGWTVFVPARSPACPGRPFPASQEHEAECGRVLGLRFDPRGTGGLYFADAYHGLCHVGSEGGVPTTLSSEADGVPFGFTNDLDVDAEGVVYFSDASSKYPLRHFLIELLEGSPHGRLLKYDPRTNETTALAQGLRFPNGVALSRDQEWVAIAETTLARVLRLWIRGPKAGTLDVLVDLPGCPDNIRADGHGNFWVALAVRRSPLMEFLMARPFVRSLVLRLPLPVPVFLLGIWGRPSATAIKISEDGEILEVLEDVGGHKIGILSTVEERDGRLWLATLLHDYLAVYEFPKEPPATLDEAAASSGEAAAALDEAAATS